MFLKCLLQTLQAFGVFVDRAHVCLEDTLLSRCGTDYFREPPEMGWAPGGPACVAEVVSEQKGCEPKLSRLDIADGLFTRAGEVTDGRIFHLGNIHGGEVPRAHQPSELDGIPTVGFHAVAGLFGNHGGRDHPAAMSLLRQITREPVPTGSRFIDTDQVFGLGWHVSKELINIGLPGADGAEVDHLSVVRFGDIGHCDGVCVDIQTDIECARRWHG